MLFLTYWILLKSVQTGWGKIKIESSLCSSSQSHFLWSFIVPTVDPSSGGTGRDLTDFCVWGSITVFGLRCYMNHTAHLQDMDHLGVTLGSGVMQIGRARKRGQNDFKVWCLCSGCSSSCVSSGFTAGCLKKWLLVNLGQPLWLMTPLNGKKRTLVFLLNLCVFPALLL